MALGLRDHLQRALLPRLVVATSRLRARQQLAVTVARLLGRAPRLELYFAFDDPYAALALPGLLRLSTAHAAELVLYPLLERGIAQDPAASARAEQALADARRLAQREQLQFMRRAPLLAADSAFLAAWCAAARDDTAMPRFAAAALQQLWLQSDGEISTQDYRLLHQQILGREPATQDQSAALADNTRRLRAKGHWESPALRFAGEWFLAHERLPQIAQRLTQLAARR